MDRHGDRAAQAGFVVGDVDLRLELGGQHPSEEAGAEALACRRMHRRPIPFGPGQMEDRPRFRFGDAPPDLDLAFGLTVTAMLLISPITWSQNLVLLVLPITLLLASPVRPDPLHWAAFGLVVATLFIPPHKVWGVLIERGFPDGTARPWHVLTALAFQCYAVLALFGLQVSWTARRSRTSSR